MGTGENNATSENGDNLWLTFRVQDNIYAINSMYVYYIAQLSEDITPVADAKEFIRGISALNGEILTIVDFRKLFNMNSIEDEINDFKEMFEQRKQDHIDWVNELISSVEENRDITLNVDPHKCAFGKWYYSYKAVSSNLAFQLKKIEKPHNDLHQAAKLICKISENSFESEEKKIKEQTEIIDQLHEDVLPNMIKLIDALEAALEHDKKEMLVAVVDNGERIGLTVDAVDMVQPLEFITKNAEEAQSLNAPDMISGFAKSVKGDDEIIMILDIPELVGRVARKK